MIHAISTCVLMAGLLLWWVSDCANVAYGQKGYCAGPGCTPNGCGHWTLGTMG